MTTYEMNDFGFDMEPMMKHREHWVEQGRRWRDLDRVVMSEEQMIALAERLMDTDYFSSQTLLRPSIPEFTALIEEDGREENTYVCFRRSVMAETDFLEPTHEGLTRTITPAVDAYVYINNKGRMCNLVATIARVELEYEGRKMTSTAQFLTWYHDDPATLYTQAIQTLCNTPEVDGETYLPVRMIMDDFASGCRVEDFDKVISVVRSRHLYLSIIIQSISQLEGLYGSARSATILNNADNLLYLGGADVATARYVGDRANLPAHSVLDMNVDEALLFQRGRAMRRVRRYRPEEHGE